MRQNKITLYIAVVLILLVIIVLSSAFYSIDETQQVVITQFGKPVGDPIKQAGLHFKVPFIQDVNYFEKRLLEWDGNATEISAKDKKFILVDTYARWRIEKFNLSDLSEVQVESVDQTTADDRPFSISTDGTYLYIAGDSNGSGRLERRLLSDLSLDWGIDTSAISYKIVKYIDGQLYLAGTGLNADTSQEAILEIRRIFRRNLVLM